MIYYIEILIMLNVLFIRKMKILLPFLVMLAVVCAGCADKEQKSLKHSGLEDVVFSSKKTTYKWNFKRNYVDTLIEESKVRFDDFTLLSIKSVGDSMLGCLDYKNGKIHFLSSHDFRTLSSFGHFNDSLNKHGEIMFFDFYRDYLYMYNFTDRSIYKYVMAGKTLSDKFMLHKKTGIPNNAGVYRAAYLNDNNIIWASPNDKNGDLIFSLRRDDFADSTSNKDYSLSGLLKMSGRYNNNLSMSYDGYFISDWKSDYLVYMCSFTGYFIAFDKKTGSIKFDKKTIDQTPAPIASLVEIANGVRHLEIDPDIMFFPSSSLYNNKLYVLNFITPDNSASIDIYNLNADGQYVSSLVVPNISKDIRPESIAVLDNFLFVLYENQDIFKYKIK
jgi:hypothetical protein